jgi:hypothetical protein
MAHRHSVARDTTGSRRQPVGTHTARTRHLALTAVGAAIAGREIPFRCIIA